MSAFSAGNDRPWEAIPELRSLEPIGEQAKRIHRAPNGNSTQQVKLRQRTAPIGRDWLGVVFRRGDLLLATGTSETEFVRVEDIFLDDGKGQPYTRYGSGYMVIDTRDGALYSMDPSTSEITLIDPRWPGKHLGLVDISGNNWFRSLPANFIPVLGQSFRVRCKPINGGARRSLTPEQVTAFVGSFDQQTIELYLAAGKMPLIGDPRPI